MLSEHSDAGHEPESSPLERGNEISGGQSEENVLEIALAQLDRAHQDISRLLRLHHATMDAMRAHSTSLSNSLKAAGLSVPDAPKTVNLTSHLSGTNPIDGAVRETDYEVGYLWAKALYKRLKNNKGFLRSFSKLQTKRGELTEVLALTYELAEIDKSITGETLRRLEGRLRELSGWIPKIAGKQIRIKDPVPGRVLHLVKESRPYLSNGFTSRSHKNFLAERAAGLEPIIVTEPGFPDTEGGRKSRSEENVEGVRHIRTGVGNVSYNHLPLDRFLHLFATLAYEEVKRFRPSIIHASSGRRGYDTALVGLALQEKTGLPLVYEVRSLFEANWTSDIDWETRGEVFRRRMEVEKLCMQRADHVITIGNAMKEEIVARGIPPEKVSIVPNAVDQHIFSPRPRSNQLADAHGVSDFPTYGYVSNMDHYRESQETLIEACSILKNRGSDYRCVLVGGGPRLDELRKYAQKLGVEDRVIFTGPVNHDDIPDYYSLIDCFVVPRVPERAATYVTPLKPFEAMSMGKPIVVSDLPALTEIADPPNRGRSFPPNDAETLANILDELQSHPDVAFEIAEAGRTWVTENRTWDLNGKRYSEYFAELLKGNSDK